MRQTESKTPTLFPEDKKPERDVRHVDVDALSEHELCLAFPSMAKAEYADLKADIEEHGVRVPQMA